MRLMEPENVPTISVMRLVEFEPVAVSVPPSLALEGIERYLRVRNNRLRIIVPRRQSSESHTLATTCVARVVTRSHPNKALVSRFHDRIELEWHPDDASCPDLSGRLTIRPLAGNTELIFKGRCGFDDVTARNVVHGVLEQFKDALETEFETFKDFIHAREREASYRSRASRLPQEH
jgi:virulence-associated protein VagC